MNEQIEPLSDEEIKHWSETIVESAPTWIDQQEMLAEARKEAIEFSERIIATIAADRERIMELETALREVDKEIHGEFCSSNMEHHHLCRTVTDALESARSADAGGGG